MNVFLRKINRPENIPAINKRATETGLMELKAVHTDVFFLESVSQDARGAEWKTGISCPELHTTLKCLRTDVRTATEGHALSWSHVRLRARVAAESEVMLVT